MKTSAPVPRSRWPVLLVSMPFMDPDYPSIQLGLLGAIAGRHGYPVRTLHANLDFAALLGRQIYRAISEHRGRMIGEWLFSVEAFGADAPDPDGGQMLAEFGTELFGSGPDRDRSTEALLRIRREQVPAYLDRLLDSVDWTAVRVVGFTCTFQQNTASFALARRLKRRHPHLVTVFGGANFDDVMGLEYLRRVDGVDFVVTGEGDRAFPLLLDALATGADPGAVPGVARRSPEGVTATPAAPPLGRLDDLPTPDYAEYFARAERVGLLPDRAAVSIPFEAARGCWWGAKHHCVFCGLNGSMMAFRAKAADRVIAELSEQARECRSFRFAAVDNILDPAYLRDLLPRLVESGADYEMFFEVKANLTRAQVRLLAQAGVTRIQPGIESLSTPVLRVMRKGVRAAQNVNLLRWARYYGIHVDWNLIWGFPGDDPADYAQQADIVPHLVHLQPPSDANRLWMERFSPLFTQPEAYPVKYRRPERSYRHVYPETIDLDEVAYFFDYEFVDALPDSAYASLRHAAGEWQSRWAECRPPTLTFRSTAGLLQIFDGRHPDSAGTYTFEDPIAEIYVAASDRPITVAALHGRLRSSVPLAGVREILDGLHRRGLILRDGDLVLSLALPGTTGR